MRCSMTACLGVLGTLTAVSAGPLDVSLVPSSAQWVVHVDVERAASSEVGQAVATGLDLEDEFAEMQGELGVDPWHDVASVTAYGWGEIQEHDMVLIVDGSEKLREALAHKAAEVGIQPIEEAHRTYYLGHEHGKEMAIGVIERGEGVRLVVARDREGVDAAASGRGGDPAPVVGKGPTAGAMIFAAARDVDGVVPDFGPEPHSALVNSAESILIEVSEREGHMHARLHTTCKDTQLTEDVVELLQGTLALARMAMREQEGMEPMLELASRISIASEGSTVKLEIDVPSKMIIDAMKSHQGGGAH